jgi:hypothetical protein
MLNHSGHVAQFTRKGGWVRNPAEAAIQDVMTFVAYEGISVRIFPQFHCGPEGSNFLYN